ncbi:hypothetical protein TNCV_4081421 [Trichonephila clavipes]|nr:hypothetical protein TNCV_4081421 [Trichonephila clavipes]
MTSAMFGDEFLYSLETNTPHISSERDMFQLLLFCSDIPLMERWGVLSITTAGSTNPETDSKELSPCRILALVSAVDCVKFCTGTHLTSIEEVHGKNGESPEGPSQNLAPELLPAMAAPNAEVRECRRKLL